MSDRFSRIFRGFPVLNFSVTVTFLGAFAAGCGGPATSVEGNVSYDGQLVSRGVITLTPTDGQGKAEGAKILNGSYEIATIAPGPKKVSIIGIVGNESTNPEPISSEDKSQAFDPNQGVVDIPVDAEGNGQEIEIIVGAQQINIELTAPAARK